MSKRINITSYFRTKKLLLVFLIYFIAISLNAQWSNDPTINTAICTATDTQQSPKIISDGLGGYIITWQDYRIGAFNIYAQKINSSGIVQWTADGVLICSASGNQTVPQLISDGSGGAIITWEDPRGGLDYDIYAQRINSSGIAQWTADGVAICTALGNQQKPQLISDGSGGAIITWQDYRGGGTSDIYIQKINFNGIDQWTADGVAICTTANNQFYPQLISDGSSGAIITWQDYRAGTNYDVYVQKINSSGIAQWTSDGVAISTAFSSQQNPQILSDGSGGAIITWEDLRGGVDLDIYTQRVSSIGIVQWTVNGVAICTTNGDQNIPQLTSDGSGGAIITWQDYRGGGGTSDIYVQKITFNGIILWTLDGVAVCTFIRHQELPQLTSDGLGGAIITWKDLREGTNYDIYAQSINSSGIAQWTIDGVAICTANSDQFNPQLISDGSGGAIITWEDFRGGTYDIYAQNVTANGTFLSAPILTTSSISSITASTAKSGGNISSDGGASITARGVVWDINPNPTIALQTKTNDATGTGSFTSSITGLTTGTRYYYRAYSTNSQGTSYGTEYTFTTTQTGDTWARQTDFPSHGRYEAVSFSIGAKGYIGTGHIFGGDIYKDFWEYDPTNCQWTQKADFGGSARSVAVGFSIGSKGYIGTGYDGTSNLNDFWEYDLAGNTWTQIANFGGSARYGCSGFAIGTKGYVGTGYDGSVQSDFWEYDPSTNLWTQKADYGGTRRFLAVGFTINSKGYIGTGSDGSGDTKDFYEYDPITNTWTQKANFAGVGRNSAVGFEINSKGYIGTGQNGNLGVQGFYEYDQITNTWAQKANFGGSIRSGASGFSINNVGYICFGYDGIFTQDMYSYSPNSMPTVTTTSITNVSTSSVSSGGNVTDDGGVSITARGVVWDTNPNPTIALQTKTNDATGTGSFTSSIIGLSLNTTYYVRSYATNSVGTSYGNEVIFTTLTDAQVVENQAPNNGDGNSDGIKDSEQDYVVSILNPYTNKFITVFSLDKYTISNVEIQKANDNRYYYPANLVKFTINKPNARVKIYYHNIESLNGYSFKKLNSRDILFDFTNYTLGSELIDGKTVATATLVLTDGGAEDYDGLLNGSITDPGGPAILISNLNIPIWNWKYVVLLISLISVSVFRRPLNWYNK